MTTFSIASDSLRHPSNRAGSFNEHLNYNCVHTSKQQLEVQALGWRRERWKHCALAEGHAVYVPRATPGKKDNWEGKNMVRPEKSSA